MVGGVEGVGVQGNDFSDVRPQIITCLLVSHPEERQI